MDFSSEAPSKKLVLFAQEVISVRLAPYNQPRAPLVPTMTKWGKLHVRSALKGITALKELFITRITLAPRAITACVTQLRNINIHAPLEPLTMIPCRNRLPHAYHVPKGIIVPEQGIHDRTARALKVGIVVVVLRIRNQLPRVEGAQKGIIVRLEQQFRWNVTSENSAGTKNLRLHPEIVRQDTIVRKTLPSRIQPIILSAMSVLSVITALKEI